MIPDSPTSSKGEAGLSVRWGRITAHYVYSHLRGRFIERMGLPLNFCGDSLTIKRRYTNRNDPWFESRSPYQKQMKYQPIIWSQKMGRPECPYFQRWVLNFWFFSIRLHHFISSDDKRTYHDHPWWFLTLVLAGSYTDISDVGVEDSLTKGSIRLRPASHRHIVSTDGVWTLVLTGPESRIWGFYPKGKFLRREKYFKKYGHHACD